MKNYGKVFSQTTPPEVEINETTVFIASNVVAQNKQLEGRIIPGYEYDYNEYTKDEYLVLQNEKIHALEQELAAAKILLGVD